MTVAGIVRTACLVVVKGALDVTEQTPHCGQQSQEPEERPEPPRERQEAEDSPGAPRRDELEAHPEGEMTPS